MPEIERLGVIAEACLDANKAIQADGTPPMKILIRLLLFEIGEEIGRREADRREMCDGE